MKIIQSINGRYHQIQVCGNARIGVIRKVLFAVDTVTVDLRSEGCSDALRRPAKLNSVSRARNARYIQALLLQPLGDAGYVVGTRSKALRILFRSQPAMVVRRGRILLLAQELVEIA